MSLWKIAFEPRIIVLYLSREEAIARVAHRGKLPTSLCLARFVVNAFFMTSTRIEVGIDTKLALSPMTIVISIDGVGKVIVAILTKTVGQLVEVFPILRI